MGDEPEDTYFNGDDFKGLRFSKFTTVERANNMIGIINKNKPKYKDSEISGKPDAPVEVRAVRSLLLGIRWQLNEWGSFDKKAIKVDVLAGTMTVHKKEVVSVGIEDGKLKISWLDDTWKE